MSEYIIQGETLTAIADAIRKPAGRTTKIAAQNMAEKITALVDDVIGGDLTSIYSETTSLIGYACYNWSIRSAKFPNVTYLGASQFRECGKLQSVEMPRLTGLGTCVFYGCKAMEKADWPLLTSVGTQTFYNCTALVALVLRSESMATLSATSAFTGTPIASGTGYIYVPAALVDSYKAATNWSTYAAQFRALEDYTVDGTTTGALDETKINA